MTMVDEENGSPYAISGVVPNVDEEQAEAAWSVIFSQPREEWALFARMLGLTNELVVPNRRTGQRGDPPK